MNFTRNFILLLLIANTSFSQVTEHEKKEALKLAHFEEFHEDYNDSDNQKIDNEFLKRLNFPLTGSDEEIDLWLENNKDKLTLRQNLIKTIEIPNIQVKKIEYNNQHNFKILPLNKYFYSVEILIENQEKNKSNQSQFPGYLEKKYFIIDKKEKIDITDGLNEEMKYFISIVKKKYPEDVFHIGLSLNYNDKNELIHQKVEVIMAKKLESDGLDERLVVPVVPRNYSIGN